MPDRFAGRPRLLAGELSPRELEVLSLIAYGATDRRAAAALYISVRTAEDHVRKALERCELHNRYDLVRYAVERGMIDTSRGVDEGPGFPADPYGI